MSAAHHYQSIWSGLSPQSSCPFPSDSIIVELWFEIKNQADEDDMKSSSTRDWLIDSVIIMILAGIAVFMLPLLSAWFSALSLRLGRTLFWVHSIALDDLLPHVMVGSLLGLATAWLIRHPKLWLAILPTALLCLFYGLYFSFGSTPYPWGHSRFDFVMIGSWMLLVAAALFSGRVVLKRRQRDDPTFQPIAAAPVR